MVIIELGRRVEAAIDSASEIINSITDCGNFSLHSAFPWEKWLENSDILIIPSQAYEQET